MKIDYFYQGRSLGTLLIRHRIEQLKADKRVKRIIVRTSQFAHGFYGKQGFHLLGTEPNYWAEGIDLYLMEYHL